MALFKPKGADSKTTGASNRWTGICEIGIKGFTDKSKDFDWADIYIDAEIAVKDSEYTRNLKISGSLDKDVKGNVSGGTVLNRMYKFFDDIGCEVGINLKGKWEKESDGKAVKDIAKYLNDHHTDKLHSYPYLGYIYKEKNKKNGKAYNTVLWRVFPNTSNGRSDLASYVKWMKTNGHIKEVSAEAPAPVAEGNTDLPFSLDEAL